MQSKVLAIFAAVLLLGACSSSPEESGTSAAATGATTSGSESNFAAGTQEDLAYNVGDRVYFDFDRSEIRADGEAVLQRVAAWLGQNPAVTLNVEGHADERGTREYNLALGERRASSAKSYLVALGVDPNRLRPITYGKERPAVVGSNDEAWAQNRRAVFVVN